MTPEERRVEALRSAAQVYEGRNPPWELHDSVADQIIRTAMAFERWLQTGVR